MFVVSYMDPLPFTLSANCFRIIWVLKRRCETCPTTPCTCSSIVASCLSAAAASSPAAALRWIENVGRWIWVNFKRWVGSTLGVIQGCELVQVGYGWIRYKGLNISLSRGLRLWVGYRYRDNGFLSINGGCIIFYEWNMGCSWKFLPLVCGFVDRATLDFSVEWVPKPGATAEMELIRVPEPEATAELESRLRNQNQRVECCPKILLI